MHKFELRTEIDNSIELECSEDQVHEATVQFIEESLKHGDHADLCHHLSISQKDYRRISEMSQAPEDSDTYKAWKELIIARAYMFDHYNESINDIAERMAIEKYQSPRG